MNITLDVRSTKYPLPAQLWSAVVNECNSPHLGALRKVIARQCNLPVTSIAVHPSTILAEGGPYVADTWPSDKNGRVATDFRIKVKVTVDAAGLGPQELERLEEIAAGKTVDRLLKALKATFRAYETRLEIINRKEQTK